MGRFPDIRSLGMWLMLATTLVIAAAPARAAGPTAAASADLTAEACAILRDDPGAALAFPGAAAYLCEGKRYADGFCSARPPGQCTIDSVCALRYGACVRQPCRPVVTVEGCDFAPQQNLVKVIRHFRICQRSGGEWVSGGTLGGGSTYGGGCSCMGASVKGALLTSGGGVPRDYPSPATFYVGERGCVSERKLCDEHRGRWIATRPSTMVTQSMPAAGCKLWPHATWRPDADPSGICNHFGVAADARAERKGSCEASHGRWRPNPQTAGLCTFDRADSQAPLFRAHCAIDGVAASWGMLEPQIGFPHF